MARAIITVIAAAALGSLLASVVLCLSSGGDGWPLTLRLATAYTSASMFFTVPGIIVLIIAQGVLKKQGFSGVGIKIFIVLAGTAAGGLVLSLLLGGAAIGLGAGYGFASAIALVAIQSIFTKLRDRPLAARKQQRSI